jgi:hypothetical protein
MEHRVRGKPSAARPPRSQTLWGYGRAIQGESATLLEEFALLLEEAALLPEEAALAMRESHHLL